MEKQFKKEHLLFVDDDSITNYLHEFILTKQINYQGNLHFCINGRESLEYLRDLINKEIADIKFPSLIFLDINMPELDGFGFIEAYQLLPKKVTESTAIIILTSSLNESDREKAFTYPMVKNYLLKPLNASTIEKILGK